MENTELQKYLNAYRKNLEMFQLCIIEWLDDLTGDLAALETLSKGEPPTKEISGMAKFPNVKLFPVNGRKPKFPDQKPAA